MATPPVIDVAVRVVLALHRERGPIDEVAVVRDVLRVLRGIEGTGGPVETTARRSQAVVTERDVVDAALSGGRIVVGRGGVVTPLAREVARERGVVIEMDGA